MFNRFFVATCRVAGVIGVVAVTMAPIAASAEGNKQQKAATASMTGFNWLANGNDAQKREARARQAAVRASYMSTRGGATWICSPAGFGRKSHCYRG